MWYFGALTIILIVFFGLSYLAKRSISGDPIDSIQLDGCLGFKIGDSRAFVESRINHLGLIPEGVDDEISRYVRKNSPCISVKVKEQPYIESMSFHFSGGILMSIMLQLKDNSNKGSTDLIKTRITAAIGGATRDGLDFTLWKHGALAVVFEHDKYIGINKA